MINIPENKRTAEQKARFKSLQDALQVLHTHQEQMAYVGMKAKEANARENRNRMDPQNKDPLPGKPYTMDKFFRRKSRPQAAPDYPSQGKAALAPEANTAENFWVTSTTPW